ncbi:MAG: DNA methyltransferase [Candidatus Weimeria sp.]
MTDSQQREAARQFANKWMNGGDEKQDCHAFWIQLLQDVLGVANVTEYIQFEKSVKLIEADGKIHTRYIDGYIPEVKVLIEQKGSSHALDVKEHQSGGEELTPFEQAKRYNDNIAYSENARWIVTSNFTNIWIYDMENPVADPVKIETMELQQKYPMLDFLVKKEVKEISHEMEVSIKAGDIVGLLYDAFLKQYKVPETAPKDETDEEKAKRENKLRSLNALCVRLVFLLYAEDTDILGKRNMFHDFLSPLPVNFCRESLKKLFKVLDTPLSERDEYLEEEYAQFPYVNGGLFADETIEIPPFTGEIKALILKNASEDFNWRDISPTIFGAVFESTLNPETRRSGGMHYTSIENIHKVIDPLFLDDLKKEFKDICAISSQKKKEEALDAFQEKLGSLKFLDPACGSGNFLTETYLSLRRLENEVLKEKSSGQISLVFNEQEKSNPIRVSIRQFYGIEINDFAATVAKTALWIAESQMLEETESILFGFNEDFLPLKTYVNITEGNALRIDWNEVVKKDELNYIMGNPPFVGYSLQSKEQKDDILHIYIDERGKPYKTAGKIDYVSGWYFKASEMIQGTDIRAAFVSTNSITQGEQVAGVWKPLYERFGIHIDFAYRTFRWDSEANIKAHVHCVIVGFSCDDKRKKKKLYITTYKKDVDGKTAENLEQILPSNINSYLIDAPDIYIESRSMPICDVSEMVYGNKPTDGGFLFLTEDEKAAALKGDPNIKKYIRRVYGATEYINNRPRYCLWLVGASPADISGSKFIYDRVRRVKEFRLNSPKEATRRSAETPTLFQEIRQPDSDYIIVPRHSSEKRRYIPFGFLSPDIIVNDAVQIIPDATLYEFGILMSNIHMAWTRVVCGRIKSDYRYSKDIVYNNFPWPTPTSDQKQRIEQTAQGILDARALYPDSSLADLYDPLTMPPELRKAHTANDIAVMKAYGFDTKMTEADCVAELMKMYQQLTS